jgi:hypothetical protein
MLSPLWGHSTLRWSWAKNRNPRGESLARIRWSHAGQHRGALGRTRWIEPHSIPQPRSVTVASSRPYAECLAVRGIPTPIAAPIMVLATDNASAR